MREDIRVLNWVIGFLSIFSITMVVKDHYERKRYCGTVVALLPTKSVKYDPQVVMLMDSLPVNVLFDIPQEEFNITKVGQKRCFDLSKKDISKR